MEHKVKGQEEEKPLNLCKLDRRKKVFTSLGDTKCSQVLSGQSFNMKPKSMTCLILGSQHSLERKYDAVEENNH